jgi:hypothetical protein
VSRFSRERRKTKSKWIPAFAGMTAEMDSGFRRNDGDGTFAGMTERDAFAGMTKREAFAGMTNGNVRRNADTPFSAIWIKPSQLTDNHPQR